MSMQENAQVIPFSQEELIEEKFVKIGYLCGGIHTEVGKSKMEEMRMELLTPDVAMGNTYQQCP